MVFLCLFRTWQDPQLLQSTVSASQVESMPGACTSERHEEEPDSAHSAHSSPRNAPGQAGPQPAQTMPQQGEQSASSLFPRSFHPCYTSHPLTHLVSETQLLNHPVWSLPPSSPSRTWSVRESHFQVKNLCLWNTGVCSRNWYRQPCTELCLQLY